MKNVDTLRSTKLYNLFDTLMGSNSPFPDIEKVALTEEDVQKFEDAGYRVEKVKKSKKKEKSVG